MKYVNNDEIDSILKLYGYEKNPKYKHKDNASYNSDVEHGFQDMNPLIANNKNISNEDYTNEIKSLKNDISNVNKRVNEVYKILNVM